MLSAKLIIEIKIIDDKFLELVCKTWPILITMKWVHKSTHSTI